VPLQFSQPILLSEDQTLPLITRIKNLDLRFDFPIMAMTRELGDPIPLCSFVSFVVSFGLISGCPQSAVIPVISSEVWSDHRKSSKLDKYRISI